MFNLSLKLFSKTKTITDNFSFCFSNIASTNLSKIIILLNNQIIQIKEIQEFLLYQKSKNPKTTFT